MELLPRVKPELLEAPSGREAVAVAGSTPVMPNFQAAIRAMELSRAVLGVAPG